MSQYDGLSDQARAGLDQLSKAAKSEAESSVRLEAAIDNLDSPSSDTRLAAARTLLRGGNAAIAASVAAVISDNPSAPRDQILRVMLQLGPGGIEALRQLALYGTDTVRESAIGALARISRRAHAADLVTAYYAANATDRERAVAEANLRRLEGGIPDLESALAILRLDLADKRGVAELADNDGQITTLWEINEQKSGVTHQPTARMYAAYRDAVDAGNRLRRIGGLSIQQQSEILAAVLAYHVMVDPDWGDRDQVAAIRNAYGLDVDTSLISTAIRHAAASGDDAAAIGLLRLVDVQTPSVLDRSLLLHDSLAIPTPLVGLASSPAPQVRYEAALVIAALAKGAPFPGSSLAMRTLSEMTSLTDEPIAILVETRPDVVIALEGILSGMGFRVVSVGSVKQSQRCVRAGGDIRLILSKTQLPDLPPVEMVDSIRRLDRGRQLPILFYDGELPGLAYRRWDAPTLLIDRPVSSAGLAGWIEMDRRSRRLPALTELDRRSFRQAAQSYFDRPASDPTIRDAETATAKDG
jgi:hypothetical protein